MAGERPVARGRNISEVKDSCIIQQLILAVEERASLCLYKPVQKIKLNWNILIRIFKVISIKESCHTQQVNVQWMAIGALTVTDLFNKYYYNCSGWRGGLSGHKQLQHKPTIQLSKWRSVFCSPAPRLRKVSRPVAGWILPAHHLLRSVNSDKEESSWFEWLKLFNWINHDPNANKAVKI